MYIPFDNMERPKFPLMQMGPNPGKYGDLGKVAWQNVTNKGGGGGGNRGFGKKVSRCALLRTSFAYQTKQFFDNSTLHGVRYIREEGRPFCERFMWFCFTSIGGIATLIIISTLWEKFQTNPTITGLDTDFHNWDVPFPAVYLCFKNPINDTAIEEYVNSTYGGSEGAKTFLRLVTNFSYHSLPDFQPLLRDSEALLDSNPLQEYQKMFVKSCEELMPTCQLRGLPIKCCDVFLPMATEIGFCYVFNSRVARLANRMSGSSLHHIRETDEKWTLMMTFSTDYDNPEDYPTPIGVYVQSNDMSPVLEVAPQHEWEFQTTVMNKLSFSSKQTYTTEDARQLSIRQRRCVFADEIKLDTDNVYTYTACMQHCRLQRVRAACGCAPFFYGTVKNIRFCETKDLKCLVDNQEKFVSNSRQCKCDLGCMNTVYEIEKVEDLKPIGLFEVGFVSWPIVRYKREVLFGWVDLLVSFGGIAGLFLGFSLLSGVEILYYFTMRTHCMVIQDADELRRLRYEKETAPRPPLDLSLTPYFLLPPDGAEGGGGGLTRVRPSGDGRRLSRQSPFAPPHNVLRRQYLNTFLP